MKLCLSLAGKFNGIAAFYSSGRLSNGTQNFTQGLLICFK